jgi:hypothetical protein
MKKAPKGKFRLIIENKFSETHIADDYPTLKRAEQAAKMIASKLQKCYIYDENGNCIDVYEQT